MNYFTHTCLSTVTFIQIIHNSIAYITPNLTSHILTSHFFICISKLEKQYLNLFHMMLFFQDYLHIHCHTILITLSQLECPDTHNNIFLHDIETKKGSPHLWFLGNLYIASSCRISHLFHQYNNWSCHFLWPSRNGGTSSKPLHW